MALAGEAVLELPAASSKFDFEAELVQRVGDVTNRRLDGREVANPRERCAHAWASELLGETDVAVPEVLYVSADTKFRGHTIRKIAVTDTLHAAFNQKLFGDFPARLSHGTHKG